MLRSILAFAARFAVGKKILVGLDYVNAALTGGRSEILISLVIVVSTLKYAGLLDAQQADDINKCLVGALPITLMERVSKIKRQADKIIPIKETPKLE